MTLSAMAFLRGFVQHVLPRGFVRIRHSGFLANASRVARVALARTLLATTARHAPSDTAVRATTAPVVRATWACPRCGTRMIVNPILSADQFVTAVWRIDTS